MSCTDTARKAALKAADDLEQASRRFGVMRSVDATEASRWLAEIVESLREAAGEPEKIDAENEVGR